MDLVGAESATSKAAWGSAPGFSLRDGTSAESAIQRRSSTGPFEIDGRADESRLSALVVCGGARIPGALPRAIIERRAFGAQQTPAGLARNRLAHPTPCEPVGR